jgi:UDP-N-acetylmuramyl pentapeptide synthase
VIKLVLGEMIEALEGKPSGAVPPMSVGGVSTDSRGVKAGELFFALAGPTFDGHAFVADALRRGAAGAVVAAEKAAAVADALRAAGVSGLLIEVKDPVAALGKLATSACAGDRRTGRSP